MIDISHRKLNNIMRDLRYTPDLKHLDNIAKRIFKSDKIMIMYYRKIKNNGETESLLEIGVKDPPNSYARFKVKLAEVPVKNEPVFRLSENREAVIDLLNLAKVGMFK